MRRSSLVGWCLAFLILPVGCDTAQFAQQVTAVLDTPESLMECMVGCEESLIDLLATVNSEQAAQDALPRATELAQQFEDYSTRFVLLAQDKPPDAKRFSELFDERLKSAKSRFILEIKRFSEDPALKTRLPDLTSKFVGAQIEFQRRISLLRFGYKLDANGDPIETGPPAPPAAPGPPPPPLPVAAAPERRPRFESQLPHDPTGAGLIASAPQPAAALPADEAPVAAESPPESSPRVNVIPEAPDWAKQRAEEARKRAEEAHERIRSGQPPFGPGGPPFGGGGFGPGGPGMRGGPPRPVPPEIPDAVTIVLLRRPADGGDKLAEIIGKLDKFKGQLWRATDNSFRMSVGPVANIGEFAKKLTWAKVVSVDEDGRTITIEIDKAKYP